jgi:peptide/nickel transport system substrate-binding protein
MPAAAPPPLITPKHVDFVSKRVGNYIWSKQYRMIVTQAWVQ